MTNQIAKICKDYIIPITGIAVSGAMIAYGSAPLIESNNPEYNLDLLHSASAAFGILGLAGAINYAGHRLFKKEEKELPKTTEQLEARKKILDLESQIEEIVGELGHFKCRHTDGFKSWRVPEADSYKSIEETEILEGGYALAITRHKHAFGKQFYLEIVDLNKKSLCKKVMLGCKFPDEISINRDSSKSAEISISYDPFTRYDTKTYLLNKETNEVGEKQND